MGHTNCHKHGIHEDHSPCNREEPAPKPLLNIRQILEYYANEEGYVLKSLGRDGEWWVRDGEIVRNDRGQKAREALKELGDLAVTIEVTDEMVKAGRAAHQLHNDEMEKIGLYSLGDYKGIFKAMLRAWKDGVSK